MQYVIGIDGGGSRSRLVAINTNKEIIAHCEGGTTNITAETYHGVYTNMQQLLADFCATAPVSLEGCKSLYIGSAGASTGDNANLLTNIFRDLGIQGKIKVTNDAELALLTATGEEPGIIIISGTGSVGYAIDKAGTTHRAGGWGHIIDDGGSGYRIGMDAIKAALMETDGRGPKTILTGMVTQFFDLASPVQILGYIYSNEFHKSKIAKLSVLVEEAANLGDGVAAAIEAQAASDLIALAHSLMHRAQLFEHNIVLSGSIILRSKNIRPMFEAAIAKAFPNTSIKEMNESAELGAAYIALKLISD
ncbi:MAG: hypothetical protein FWC92_06850 [Defluviitaleaceae bacterium]|nr:hypothetical protein [Defluviitaleaceae bacterium]